jgi:transposase-like protein
VEQIVSVLKQAERGAPVAEVIRKVGISEQTFYRWKKQYVGMETDQARQMKQLQEDNGQEEHECRANRPVRKRDRPGTRLLRETSLSFS